MEDTNCEFRSECCEGLPTGQVSFDHSDDLGSLWGGRCFDCGEVDNFSCYAHIGCLGENAYPILVKPEFS